jgi:hypothetical protein
MIWQPTLTVPIKLLLVPNTLGGAPYPILGAELGICPYPVLATNGVGGEMTYCFLPSELFPFVDGPSADGTAVDVDPEVEPDLRPEDTILL